MPSVQVNFADVEYWNARFRTESQPFEWLQSPDHFIPYVKTALESVPEQDRCILHIGPGSSTLSLNLRDLVSAPQQVHNVDYSQDAVDLGKAMEKERYGNSVDQSMRWSCADLLNRQSLLTLVHDDIFGDNHFLVVDKSTTDAVACGPDIKLNIDMYKHTSTAVSGTEHVVRTDIKLHPVAVLALHLAALTVPGAIWLSLSYSSERFVDAFEPISANDTEAFQPGAYWTLERVDTLDEHVVDGSVAPVHRPRVTHWLYILRRTDREFDLSPI